MSNQTPTYRCFHPLIADAYTAVHQWLNGVNVANGYKSIDPRGKWTKILQGEDLKSVAFQYYHLFPTHYFKAAHILENVVGEDRLVNWLRHKQRIYILDIGCGAGAGTAALIEAVLTLIEKGKISNEINIFSIGVDPNKFSLLLYKQLMTKLQSSTADVVRLEFTCVKSGFPEATLGIIQYLKRELDILQLPCLSNILTIQLNVISPFSQTFRNQENEYKDLLEIDPEMCSFLTEVPEKFGNAEAHAYKQIIEDVPVDMMHILTIATKNLEKYVQVDTDSKIALEERVKEMTSTLRDVMKKRHKVEQVHDGNHEIFFENPNSSYWKDKLRNYNGEPIKFYADFQAIWSADRSEDNDWNRIISVKNLRLAWARAHHNLLQDSLCDEIELRLFETNLDARLMKLQEQLCAYNNDVASVDQSIPYKFPKNVTDTRPRGLSRIEEEVLSVSLIQQFGNRASRLGGVSYAYRLQNTANEYLYTPWYIAYRNYIQRVQDSANRHPNGVVLRIDIESYYTRIVQQQLCDELTKELRVKSERVQWLIRVLLSKELDEHTPGQGITQGSIGSGFYSNIYLTPIDEIFGSTASDNKWSIEFHRFVDDMVLIIPDPTHTNDIEKIIEEELEKLSLNLNKGKTERFDKNNISEFLEQTKEDEYLDQLHKWYECIVNPLWISSSDHRDMFVRSQDNDDLWWHNIGLYQSCLRSINIHVSNIYISRNVYKYLFNKKRLENDLANRKKILNQEGELKSTRPPINDSTSSIRQWTDCFTSDNNEWIRSRDELQEKLVKLFCDSWDELCKSDDHGSSRKLITYIRFALTKLSVLGLRSVINPLIEILCTYFWIIRDPLHLLENLALQGFHAEIKTLLTHYQNLEQSAEYLKAITIRAMRFLPKIDAQEWEIIVKFSTISDGSISIPERLMATETWLYLEHKYNDFKQSRHIEAVKNALRSEPSPPSRLEKNYLLILGQFEPNAVLEFSINVNDPMLVDARNLALQGDTSAIFDLPEPKILRDNYYSGQSPTDTGGDGSP